MTDEENMLEKLLSNLSKSSEPEKVDFEKIRKNQFIDVNEKISPPPIALSVGEHSYGTNLFPTPFGTYGNFSCLVGASKSMKTFLKSAIASAYIGGNSNNYFPNMKGHDTDDKLIIDIDTEQSRWHAQRVAHRTCSMVGGIYDLYKPFELREQDPLIRFQFINWLIMESDYKDKIGLVLIDGAADLVNNVNDIEESNNITNHLMKWTSVSNCHLVTVLHRNHGSDKPTGHLGSSIMKKAETVAFVTRDNGITKVTPDYCRNYPFDEFNFYVDNIDHLPRLVDGNENKNGVMF